MIINNEPVVLKVGDDVSNLKIYEIINKYFGQNYKAWMRAWYDINDDFAAWFPKITKTDEKPNGTYGGTRSCSNTLSSDMKTIIEINHESTETLEEEQSQERFNKHRLVFARINGKFYFLGVFDRKLGMQGSHVVKMHYQIAEGIDLRTFKLL